MMKLLKLLQYNKRNHFKPGQEIEFFGPEIKVLDKLLMPYMMRRAIRCRTYPNLQIKVNHPIYPKNMMRKELIMANTTIIGIAVVQDLVKQQ